MVKWPTVPIIDEVPISIGFAHNLIYTQHFTAADATQKVARVKWVYLTRNNRSCRISAQ